MALNGFRETVAECGITDLPMEGYPYTWQRSRGTERWVEERLDGVFVNEKWRLLFPYNKVHNLIALLLITQLFSCRLVRGDLKNKDIGFVSRIVG